MNRGGNVVESPVIPHRPNAPGHQDSDLHEEGYIQLVLDRAEYPEWMSGGNRCYSNG